MAGFYRDFSIGASHTNLSGITWNDIAQIIDKYPNAGYIFYVETVEFYLIIQFAELENMRCIGEIGPTIIILSNSVCIYLNEERVIERDWYSLGKNIGEEYLNEEGPSAVLDIYERFGYFPIIAPDDYKNNTEFLMGISHALGVPVKIVSSAEEIEQETSKLAEEGLELESWIIVDADKLSNEGAEDDENV